MTAAGSAVTYMNQFLARFHFGIFSAASGKIRDKRSRSIYNLLFSLLSQNFL
jgi:hypothetical protein